MVELKTKVSKGGVLYVPNEIREAFGREMKVIVNCVAALFFPANADYKDVLESLRLIELEIHHRMKLMEKTS
jgi:bifunctional DNA-binding transcriptional regulator/antitoxin component of YhaV-PrlF toxin-antitoxin module